MNEQNLIPNSERTPSELREITRKGGVKSGESRRRKRDLKRMARRFLDADTDREDLRAALQSSGFTNDQSNAAVLILQIGNEAFAGNMRAAELLIKLSGDDPDQKRKDEEIKIKRETLEFQKDRFAPRETDIEDLSCVWNMIMEPDDPTPMPVILDPEGTEVNETEKAADPKEICP